jgi:hypothetical protein
MPTNSSDACHELAQDPAAYKASFLALRSSPVVGLALTFEASRRTPIAVKVHSPLLGFNNNVKHKGRVFHVQTEDSGVRHPHVITHLFADGGRILKTMKTSYAEHLNEGNLRDIVHQLMKEQHKAMFVALRDGQFDHIFEEKEATIQSPGAPAPPAAAAAPDPASGVVDAPAPPTVAVPVHPASATASQPVSSGVRPVAPEIGSSPSDGIALEFRGIDGPIAIAEPHVGQAPKDIAPPPSAVKSGGNLFTAGVYRTLANAAPSTPSAGRYSHTRPPAIFGSTRTQNVSIFGEDLISEKSLDEVILSYLAEDLENEEGA